MHKFVGTLLLFFIIVEGFTQTKHTHANMLWFNYNNYIQLNDKYTVVNDVQIRTRDWTNRWSQFAIRTGLTYKINKQFTVAGGIAWFGGVRYLGEKKLLANEWRPWQEIAFQLKSNQLSLLQRIRIEERFLELIVNGKNTHNYVNRLRVRYRIEMGFPLYKKQITAAIGNEIMVNADHINDDLFFDQNRTYFLANFKISPAWVFQFQYIKLFQWLPSVDVLDNQDVFRFSLHHTISCHPKKN